MGVSVIDDLKVECMRAKQIIASCESTPSISFVAIWLRALVRRSEQAIRERDVVACVACLREIREVKER